MSTKTRIDAESRKDPHTLEREIEATRAEIRSIVQALEHRLAPGQLFDRAMSFVRSNGGQFAGNLGATVKANPVPTVLTSIGLLWLMASDRSQAARGTHAGSHTGSSMREGAAHMRESVSGSLHGARERLGQAGDSMHGAADSVRRRAQDARQGFDDLMTQQPLAVGAIGIAMGALLGALLPRTQQEDQLLGSASDRARERATEAASDTLERADESLAQRRGDGAGRGDSAASPQPRGPTG